MHLSKSVRKTPTVDGAVLLDVHSGLLFRANPLATKIIELVDQGICETQIVEEICRVFETSSDIVRVHVHEFLASLDDHHLLAQSRSDVPAREK